MSTKHYLFIEAPDRIATVDFTAQGEHAGATVKLMLEKGKLHVCIIGDIDTAPILLDTILQLPDR